MIIKYKRIIAILLVVFMLLPIIQPCSVRAETDSSKFIIKIIHEYEVRQEAKEDVGSKKTAGDWTTARNTDKIPWNFFTIKYKKH